MRILCSVGCCENDGAWKLIFVCDPSPFTHHFTAPSRSRLESCCPSYVHSRAQINAGADHKVRASCLPPEFPGSRKYTDMVCDSCSFMAHPETLLPISTIDDPLERFVAVVKFYLSGWHIKPPYGNLHIIPEEVAG